MMPRTRAWSCEYGQRVIRVKQAHIRAVTRAPEYSHLPMMPIGLNILLRYTGHGKLARRRKRKDDLPSGSWMNPVAPLSAAEPTSPLRVTGVPRASGPKFSDRSLLPHVTEKGVLVHKVRFVPAE